MKNDPVEWPSHYQGGGLEVIDVIVKKKLSFCLGQVVKYVLRAGKKTSRKSGKVEDLKKARWYLNMEIHLLGGGPDPREEGRAT